MISQSMDNKREIILKSALELFVNQGFHATPTSQIANKAGVANGTLFHYFNTKEDLINALYIETKDRFFNHVITDLKADKNLRENIRNIWNNTIDWALENSYEFRFIQQFANSPFISQLTQEQIAVHHKFFENKFQEGIELGIIKPIEKTLLMQLTLSQIYGFISYLLENPDNRKNQHILDTAFSCLWDSIKL